MAALADADGVVIRKKTVATPAGLAEGLSLLKQLVRDLGAAEDIRAIGAAIGGPLDWQQGVVSPLHQPEWRQVPLKQIMEDEFGVPFRVEVDTDAAALAEYHFGGKNMSQLLYLTISTGMGGGFIIDGEIYRGAAGIHPEVGHMSVPMRCRFPERVKCECGAPDCLEALVSGNGIQRIYQKPAENLSSEEWQEVGWHLGQGLRNLSVIYAPAVIAIGGGVAIGGGAALLGPARAVLKDHLKIIPPPEVRLSQLGYETALVGAISLAISSRISSSSTTL